MVGEGRQKSSRPFDSRNNESGLLPQQSADEYLSGWIQRRSGGGRGSQERTRRVNQSSGLLLSEPSAGSKSALQDRPLSPTPTPGNGHAESITALEPVAANANDGSGGSGRSLSVVPITFDESNEFVLRHHRHHKPCVSHKFSVAVADTEIRGVAIIGRPVARSADDGWTLEVNRCCTDGTKNACSMLYSAAWRAARAMGYRKLITYTLRKEGGASLRGAGFKVVAETKGGSWDCPSRPRVDMHPTEPKLRWEKA